MRVAAGGRYPKKEGIFTPMSEKELHQVKHESDEEEV